MVEPLSVNTDVVRTLGGIHAGVAAGLGALAADVPGSDEVTMSHGAIASGVNSALATTLGARSGSMTATQSSAGRLAELLRQAALAYERGDQRGGAAIKAAADAIAQGGTPGARPDSGAAPQIDPVIGPANRSSTDAASPPQR